MTEYEAINRLQDVIKKINRVKKDYDRNYMFHPQSFFRQYMSTNFYPLATEVSSLLEYISEEKLINLQVEDIWTSDNGGTIEYPMWMYFFDNWMNLTR